MNRELSDRTLLLSSFVCALLPVLTVAASLNLSARVGEALFFGLVGALIPALWLGLTIAYYRRVRTKKSKWLFALAPIAFVYPLAALLLAIAVVVKPGRW